MGLQRGKRKGSMLMPKYVAVIIFLVLALVTIFQDKFIYKKASRGTSDIQRVSGVSKDEYVKVTKVHDGDTVSVIINNNEERVRLIGIDAPEMGQGQWGKKAKRKLQDIIRKSDKTVRIELDVDERDKYGRVLAYLWTKDMKMINEEMVKSGYAFLYTIPPNVRYVERLKRAQEVVSSKGIGIWSEKGLNERPSDYRKIHPRD